MHLILEECLRTKTGINIHLGKTKLWNRAGTKFDMADSLSAAAQAVKPEAVVWRGDPQLPLHRQGLIVLGGTAGICGRGVDSQGRGTCQFVREDHTHP